MTKDCPDYSVKAMLMLVMMIVISLMVGAGAHLAYASTTFTINSTGDENDADLTDGKCDVDTTTPQNQCTLRAAIQESNVVSGTDTVNFNIPGSGVQTINPSPALPTITDPVLINGYTQGDGTTGDARPNSLSVGDDAVLKIELNGADAGNGLKIEADNSTIKGLILSNWENGIFLGASAADNQVTGDFVGTDASGANLSNNIGVVVQGDENTIGGTLPAARNVISGNGAGIQFNSANGGNRVIGNYIGTEANGTDPLGNNNGVIIQASPRNTIGGTTAAERNVISGNFTFGVWIIYTGATGNRVQGNYIGIGAARGAILANGNDGVSIQSDADNNFIGGNAAGAGNVISGNGDDGVEVRYYHDPGNPIGSDPDPATGNRILSNSIYDNAALGIELRFAPNDPAGVTQNDLTPPPDSDDGPNHLQNFPEITSARLTTRRIEGQRRRVTIIRGTLTSEAGVTYNAQFFSSPAADASGFGEGKRFLGQESVTTDASGSAAFTFITTKKVPRGQVVATTATNQSTGDTSEFSRATTVN